MTANWFQNFKRRGHSAQAPAYHDLLSELFERNFFVMFLPVAPLFNGADSYKLTYPYGNLFRNQICCRDAYLYSGFDTAYYLRCLTEGKFIVVTLKELGTLVFTNHRVSFLFDILQRHYRQCTSFVFCATDNAGYFKKLQNGRISRKIASHLVAEEMSNAPETRGQPCEYELETGKIFKIDYSATYLDDLLKNFGKSEIMELLNYYVGLSNLTNERITDVVVYSVPENPNG